MTPEWVVHPLQGQFAVRSIKTDELLRGWRTGMKRLIWRGTEEEAIALCHLLNGKVVKPPEEEMSKSMKIHYMNRRRHRKSVAPANAPSFTQCPGCRRMVKPGHQCPNTEG